MRPHPPARNRCQSPRTIGFICRRDLVDLVEHVLDPSGIRTQMGPADLTGVTAGEALLDYSRAPCQRRSFSRENEACVFVKPSRWVETHKGCEITGLKTSVVQERLGSVHE